MDFEQHKAVVHDFIRENLTSRGLVADFAIHSPEASDGDRNPRAHIMFTLRPLEGDGFGKKLTGRVGGLDDKKVLADFRHSCETLLNEASSQADSGIHFDLRSLKQKGIDREPQPKIGPKVTALESRGYHTEWGKQVRQVKHANQAEAAQSSHGRYAQGGSLSHLASRAVDQVRDDVAHKYYEVMYGPDAAYGDQNREKEQDFYGYER